MRTSMAEMVRVCRRNDMEPGTARCFVVGTRVALVRIHDDSSLSPTGAATRTTRCRRARS